MKSEKQIAQNIEDTFKVLDSIEEVKVNHFFKHKVLQQLENQAEVKPTAFSWFTPKLQLAALSLVLLMNLSTLFYAYSINDASSSTRLENFAQEYALQSETNSILN